jgi:valine dehydrogenase (NAD+)
VIQVADELVGFSMDRARAGAQAIFATTEQVLTSASRAGVLPVAAAEQIAEERMAAGRWAGGLYPGLAAAGPPDGRVPAAAQKLVP